MRKYSVLCDICGKEMEQYWNMKLPIVEPDRLKEFITVKDRELCNDCTRILAHTIADKTKEIKDNYKNQE